MANEQRPGQGNLHNSPKTLEIVKQAAAEMTANAGPGQANSNTPLVHGNTLKKVTDPNIIGLSKAAK